WKTGDIASLKPTKLFSKAQYSNLLAPPPGSTRGYLPMQVCGHPIIILKRLSQRSTHALITPVSAHGSACARLGAFTLNLPWDRQRNKHKNREHYRAFDGTPRPSNRRELLHLDGEGSLPMPATSWVYIQSVWVIPVAVLRPLDPRRRLHVRADSLIDLRAHMSEECGRWKEHMERLRLVE
ncbi:hypothetical protein B0T25DRAFT_421257, partial [Lasiosphaeria hispida]